MLKKKILRILIFICVPVFFASAAVGILYVISHADAYENITILEINGSVRVERSSYEDEIVPYDNMNLTEGDVIRVSENSKAKIRLDDGNYVLLEPNTVLSVSVKGTLEKRDYILNLEEGSAITQIENKLSEDSSFKIVTQNLAASVTGTVFRVSAQMDAQGECISNVQVYDGTVQLALAGGDDSIVYLKQGFEAQAVGNNFEYEDKTINLMPLSQFGLEFLVEIIDGGTELAVDKKNINSILEKYFETDTMVSQTGEVTSDDALISDSATDSQTQSSDASGNSSNNDNSQTIHDDSQDTQTQTSPNTTQNPTTVQTDSQTEQTTQKPNAYNAETDAVQTDAVTYLVVYDLGSGYLPFYNNFNSGDSFVEPPYTIEGKSIEGWYLDSGFTQKIDENYKITSDITVYAKWAE